MRESNNLGDRLFSLASYFYLILFTHLLPLPLSGSWSWPPLQTIMVLRQDGYLPWARVWSVEAYRWVFKGSEVRTGYMVTVFITVVGTLLFAFCDVRAGLCDGPETLKRAQQSRLLRFLYDDLYPEPDPLVYHRRNLLMLHDNIWALILPMMVQPFWIFVLRNFFAALPSEIMESAYMDGASDATILFRIVLPLSKPALATVGLFIAVAYWNDWFLALMLLDFAEFAPLSLIILKMINNLQSIQDAMKYPGVSINLGDIPTLGVRMATACITIGPIILAYPFVQRYFVKGLDNGRD